MKIGQDRMSFIADALLATVERDPGAPHYVEESFRRKLDNAYRREKRLPLPPGRRSEYLVRKEWAEVIEAARLTPRQIAVLNMRFQGRTFDEIGLAGGHTKQGAQNIFFQGAKKLAKAWVEYPYRGLAQVYEEEVRRRPTMAQRRNVNC